MSGGLQAGTVDRDRVFDMTIGSPVAGLVLNLGLVFVAGCVGTAPTLDSVELILDVTVRHTFTMSGPDRAADVQVVAGYADTAAGGTADTLCVGDHDRVLGRTDSAGRLTGRMTLEDAEPGPRCVWVLADEPTATHWSPDTVTILVSLDSSGTTRVPVELLLTGRHPGMSRVLVAGVVHDSEGRPISDARVTPTACGGRSMPPGTDTIATDHEGEFGFESGHRVGGPECFLVKAGADGFEPDSVYTTPDSAGWRAERSDTVKVEIELSRDDGG